MRDCVTSRLLTLACQRGISPAAMMAAMLPIAYTHAGQSSANVADLGLGLLMSAQVKTAPAAKVITATTAQSLSVLPCFMAFLLRRAGFYRSYGACRAVLSGAVEDELWGGRVRPPSLSGKEALIEWMASSLRFPAIGFLCRLAHSSGRGAAWLALPAWRCRVRSPLSECLGNLPSGFLQ